MMVQEKLSVKIARLEKELEALHRGVSADLRPAEDAEESESSAGERYSTDKSSYASSVQAVLRARTASAASADTAMSSSTAASDSAGGAKMDAADADDATRSLELRLAALATQDPAVDSADTASGASPASPAAPPSPPPSAATEGSDEAAAPLEVPKQRGDAGTAAGGEPVRRRPTNPFRVISVGGSSTFKRAAGADGQASRTSSAGDKAAPVSADEQSMLKLQRKHDYLTMKCVKLSKEIKYLTNLKKTGSLSVEDTRKMNDALDKLQEYLDRKSKEKYEIGVLLSRRIRKHINNGSNGQFWLSGK
ncbi:AFR027Cp [Eremothecium gossypii ATCC 10895]|uniref:AFR027Cp n=1 Tax=Eremothecium gossypii (strain ATCC 10895 / CBS 109.51 / FGSC 9923 / NRRL Y-1056) TaxID=284811 RepID=Q754P5_EREGS|nr:AFR027Cp [Eremothecium gossypii ATCC 10895]AAS53398.2 AFR027Cp [Eremothecium gossypii ATCC 10895]AEY97709.1 FAFR027Cp [Eremothecium gossypii FDAG1]